MADDAIAEKRVHAMTGAVDELMREKNVGRVIVLFHRADRARGNDRVHAEGFEAEDVRAKIQIARQNAMADAMPRQKRDADAVDLADRIRVGRQSERRLDDFVADELPSLHLVEA